jgi:hypothetical protein
VFDERGSCATKREKIIESARKLQEREVLRSNLGFDICYPELSFWFPSVLADKCRDCTSIGSLSTFPSRYLQVYH